MVATTLPVGFPVLCENTLKKWQILPGQRAHCYSVHFLRLRRCPIFGQIFLRHGKSWVGSRRYHLRQEFKPYWRHGVPKNLATHAISLHSPFPYPLPAKEDSLSRDQKAKLIFVRVPDNWHGLIGRMPTRCISFIESAFMIDSALKIGLNQRLSLDLVLFLYCHLLLSNDWGFSILHKSRLEYSSCCPLIWNDSYRAVSPA